ncbi:hypothetical protein ACTZWW_12960 [Salinarimonas sp. NSM]|uniref:hypothetical protein n=1 Tax=Salinarimonas sp. NSM TaxID=3458003 RepID=UPI004036CF35
MTAAASSTTPAAPLADPDAPPPTGATSGIAASQPATSLPAVVPEPLPPALNPDWGDATGMIAAIGRLEAVLEHETTEIGRLSTAQLKELNRRKSLCLLEFTRAARPLAEQMVSPLLRARLAGLRDAIARNQAVLATHLDAVREIAGTIAGALEARESDGTYAERPVPARAEGARR